MVLPACITVSPVGCRCPNDRRRYISTIVGCGQQYGCSYDMWSCSKCPHLRYRYKSWAEQHIHYNHRNETVDIKPLPKPSNVLHTPVKLGFVNDS